MVINRETAMRIWNKAYGKSSRVKDFAGREMVKAAYDDRSSEFGWNIDHVLPQSKNGKTNDSNLICCHIKTNDEKANKFPCFNANGKKFEILKVQNHFEIREIGNDSNGNESNDSHVDFFDSASGVRFFKKLKGIQNKKIFVGSISIRLQGIGTTALVDFITELFAGCTVSYGWDDNYFVIWVSDYNMPQKEDAADLLDLCVLLNTYLGEYFVPMDVIDDYQIFYGIHHYSDKIDCLTSFNDFYDYDCPLIINELVRINTEAKQKLNNPIAIGKDELSNEVYEYNYIYTQLASNLKKLIK